MFFRQTPTMVEPHEALPGRSTPMPGVPQRHLVLDAPLTAPFGDGVEVLYVAGGCFWGIERIFWRLDGVVSTAVGYMGGHTPNPTYEETCTGRTGHAETVLVAYDPARIGADRLVATLFENHDPTTPNRQGNDVGTQYRSAIYTTTSEQFAAATAAKAAFQEVLTAAGHGTITTEIRPVEEAGSFYYAEAFHQQYLDANPNGYCNHGPNGYSCPVGLVGVPAQTDVEPPRG
ncbi:peptide-methionine (S)-S-oxide reductase MsrA [Mobilicoccus pelagius]|uniref:Peptide methionine sulfoxide reductase MsrA n=1 Tax=Mobilicoccus pelagius NBRC 104925 TaxID=1089455 RepID=H5USB4_9MICO|nr:peptide-methionine (S)-S-oxide reductase MsrA [Mobilicoccus pelagius]GAB48622.1 peptide methionine sulfoxide reductase MsrA [Mobilicoccus pelagius NBRC 104925]